MPKLWEGAPGRLSCELIRKLLAAIEDDPPSSLEKGIFNDTQSIKKDTPYTDTNLLVDSHPVANPP